MARLGDVGKESWDLILLGRNAEARDSRTCPEDCARPVVVTADRPQATGLSGDELAEANSWHCALMRVKPPANYVVWLGASPLDNPCRQSE